MVQDGRARLPLEIVWIVFGCMICQMGAGLFYASRALSPDLIASLGWTRTLWSSGMVVLLFFTSVSQAFVGMACVRFGVRPVLVAAVCCLGGSMALLATTENPWQFYAALVLLAFGNAGVGDVSIGSVITKWFDRGRGVALGFAFVGSNLGAVVFVQVIASASTRVSWREAALLAGLMACALILPFALFVVRDPRWGEGVGADVIGDEAAHEPVEESFEAGLGHASRESAPATSFTMRSAIRQPAFWIFFYTIFCYALVQLGLVDHLILHLVDLGYSKTEAAGAFQLAVGVGILSKLGAGLVAARFSAKATLIVNTLGLTLGLALVPFAADSRVLVLFGLLFGIATAARDVLLPLCLAEAFGPRYFAAIFGVLMLGFFPGGSLGPLMLARAYDVLGSYEPGFLACLGLVGSAGIALFFVPSGRVANTGPPRGPRAAAEA